MRMKIDFKKNLQGLQFFGEVVVMIIKRKQTRSFYMITLTFTIKQLLIWQVASLSRQIGREIGPMPN